MDSNPHLSLLSWSAGWRIKGDPSKDQIPNIFEKALSHFEDKYQASFELAKIHPSQASTDLYIKADELNIELQEDPRRAMAGSIWFYSSQKPEPIGGRDHEHK